MKMINTKIRRWGNSYGVLIPKEEIERKHFNENEQVVIIIKKKPNLEQLFGICKFKRPVKEIIKEIRQGYDD